MSYVKVAFVLFLSSTCLAGTATQTDWSGGDGISGPVTDWGDEFHADTDANWSSSPGDLSIESVPMAHDVDLSASGATFVLTADIDGVNGMDLVVSTFSGDDVRWYENDGSGESWTMHTIGTGLDGAWRLAIADIDGDLDPDVVAEAYYTYDLVWFENTGSDWTYHSIDTYVYFPLGLCVANVDNDADLDVIASATFNDYIHWWENVDGLGTSWSEHTITGSIDNCYCTDAADFEGDGDVDLVATASSDPDGALFWYEHNGASWTEHVIDTTASSQNGAFFVDIDDDLSLDVLSFSQNMEEIAWWEEDSGNWTKHSIDDQLEETEWAGWADLDGDGDCDVYAAGDPELVWYENLDGAGLNWTKHTIRYQSSIETRGICDGDFDGDGTTDLATADRSPSDVKWWDLFAYSEGQLQSSILDLQESPTWQDIDWTCVQPPQTTVGIQVRASDDPDNMGSWSDTLTSPGSLSGIVADQDSLFQYRVIMTTNDPDTTPTLQSVTITWEPYIGTVDEARVATQRYIFNGALPNPAFGNAVLSFALPADSRAELTIYDLTGRVVSRTEDHYPAGTHQVQLEDLASGVYLVRMRAGEFRATRRFVVIE
jgi:hypothetical protein